MNRPHDTPDHAAQRMAWAYEDAAREEAQFQARQAIAARVYIGKPSEVAMALEADGYTEAGIAFAMRHARFDTTTERLIIGA